MERELSRRDTILLLAAGTAGLALNGTGPAALRRRPIPSSGESLPVVGLGTWQTFDVSSPGPAYDGVARILRRFDTLGGTLVDTSPMYGRAEAVLGQAATTAKLERLFLATKVWTSGREAGEAQLEHSRRLLRRGTLDLVQVHNLLDLETHLATLFRQKAEGRIRYVGVTHYTEGAYGRLESVLSSQPVDFLQVNYSVLERGSAQRLLPLAASRGIAVIANRPFAGGAVFGRLQGAELPGFAAELGCRSWGCLFLKWILADPAVTCVIPATDRLDHLDDNMQAGLGRLPDERERRHIQALVG